MKTLPDRLAAVEAEVMEAWEAYQADPKNPRLSELWGELNQRRRAIRDEARKAAQPPPEPLPPAQRFLDNGEWADLLAAEHPVCPLCEGGGRTHMIWPPCPTKGYSVRIGNLGVQCTLCKGQYELGETE